MKYFSEHTNKVYETIAELEAEEAKLKKAKAEEEAAAKRAKAEREAKRTERANRAKVVEAAYDKYREAYNNYHMLLADFCKDYGSFHTSITNSNVNDTKYGNSVDALSTFLDLLLP